MSLLTTNVLVPGHDSILVLVLLKTDKQRATDIVVQKFPSIITDYGKCVMNSDKQQVINSLWQICDEF